MDSRLRTLNEALEAWPLLSIWQRSQWLIVCVSCLSVMRAVGGRGAVETTVEFKLLNSMASPGL